MNWYYINRLKLNMNMFWKNIIHMFPSSVILVFIVLAFKQIYTIE